jgi:hypothetical protein
MGSDWQKLVNQVSTHAQPIMLMSRSAFVPSIFSIIFYSVVRDGLYIDMLSMIVCSVLDI